VESVLAQSDPAWRLTVVDDGYPDESIPGWFAAIEDERVRYLRNETNLGANGNYRKCLSLAEHEVVVMMGADDLMHTNYVRTVRAVFARHPDVAFCQPGVRVVDEHDAPTRSLVDTAKRFYAPRGRGTRVLRGEDLAVSLLRGNWLYFPSVAWRRDAMTAQGFRVGFDVVQDLALALDITRAGGSLAVDDQVCFSYRRHGSSDSSWRALEGTRFAEERRFFLTVAQEMQDRGWDRAARVARRHVSSRVNAAALLPKAVVHRQASGVRNLTTHVLGRARHAAGSSS
jgi:glycosyltransferase involved in cell wall biosynthesis